MEPKVYHGPWIVMIYQCRFMNYNKCTIWCRILMWGRFKGGVPGGIWACFTFYTQFCCEPKTAIKNKFHSILRKQKEALFLGKSRTTLQHCWPHMEATFWQRCFKNTFFAGWVYHLGFSDGVSGKEPIFYSGDVIGTGSTLGWGRSPGRGHSNPLQYSCLENPMDRKPSGLQSIELQKVRNDWNNLACTHVLKENGTYGRQEICVLNWAAPSYVIFSKDFCLSGTHFSHQYDMCAKMDWIVSIVL